MNKYLVMFAAGAAAVASVSEAASKNNQMDCCKGLITINTNSTTPTGLAGGTYCDLISVGWSTPSGSAGVQSAQSDDLETVCGYNFVSHGTGAIAKVKGLGKTMVNGDDQEIFYLGGSYEGLAFEYSFPLVTGGAVSLYISTTCCSSLALFTGTYNYSKTKSAAGAIMNRDQPARKMKQTSVLGAAIAKGLLKSPKRTNSPM